MASLLNKLPLWCIVQSDGDKAYLTTHGPVPIQFCASGGSRPLIQRSLHCAVSVTRPRYIVATVAAAHRPWWSDPLWCIPPHRRVVDELTGRLTVTLAAALAVVEKAAGDALVVVQPTDAFYASARAFVAGIRRAVRVLDALAGHVVTLTVEADRIEPGQDYLLLGSNDGLPGRSTVRFVKRPPPLIAERLVDAGAQLSTGVYVTRLATLTGILADLWPDLLTAVRSLTLASSAEVLTPARMSGSHFSRPWRHTWVQRPLPRLRAVSVDDVGWSSLAAVASQVRFVGAAGRDEFGASCH